MADLSGKVALVVDAGDSLGRGIAEGLAEAGATLYLTARPDPADDAAPPASLQALVEHLRALNGAAFAAPVDSACGRALGALFDRIVAEQGRVDLLVSHVGAAAQELPQLAARAMAEQGRGLIVGIAGWEGDPDPAAAEGAHRTSGEQRLQALSRELAPQGVAALALRLAAVAEGGAPADPERGSVAPAAAPAPTSMRFNGRCVAALAMDPDILEKTGGVYRVTDLQREYRFSDPAWA